MSELANNVLANYDHYYYVRDFRRLPVAERSLVKAIVKRFELKPGFKLLDLGCGTGRYSSLFKKYGLEVTGIDFSKSAIEVAKQKYPNILFEQNDAFNLPYEKNSFDIIFAHGFSIFLQKEMPSASPFLSSMMELLKSNGLFIIINTTSLTDKYTKTKSRINYKTTSFTKLFAKVNTIHLIKSYTIFPHAFIFLSIYCFSNLVSNLCGFVTRVTGLPLRLYFFIRKN